MLTSDLVRVRRRGELLEPRYVTGKVQARLADVADALIGTMRGAAGAAREVVDAQLDGVAHKPSDRIAVGGLRKLLFDRCTFGVEPGPEPADVRRIVFMVAAARRMELQAGEVFSQAAVMEAAAEELGIEEAAVRARLFADLKANERLVEFRDIDATALVQRYNVALAQAVLLRATKVMIALDQEDAGAVRQLFREARFQGLLHRVEQRADDQWYVELDGPMSLFSASQKYGLKLALFLPAVLRCSRWRLRAELLWGKRKEPRVFELGPENGLVAQQRAISGVAPEMAKFVDGFRKLESVWKVTANDEIVALPGEVVCVPDLVFSNTQTGEEVFLEAFGFWSRTAVWQRVETIARGFPGRIILAVGKHLRVSEEVLDEDAPGELYVYKKTMRPRAVLERLVRSEQSERSQR